MHLILKNDGLSLYHQNPHKVKDSSLHPHPQSSYCQKTPQECEDHPGLRGSKQQKILSETWEKMRTNILGCPLTSTWVPWHMCTHNHTHEHAHTLCTCMHTYFSRYKMVAKVAGLDNSSKY